MSMHKLGIFWIIDDEIISFSVSLNRAEHVGGFANYPRGHVQLWPLVQRIRPRLRTFTYEVLPRGRVTHVANDGTFNLLVPHSLSNDATLVSRLVERFSLPVTHVSIVADEHYGPPHTRHRGAKWRAQWPR